VNQDRFRAFSVYPSRTRCPGEGDELRVVLFSDDAKLRSHAVSHFMNRTEQKSWQAILGYSTASLLSQCERSLGDLGCPFLTMQACYAPCQMGKGQCRLYSRCSELIEQVIQAYVEAVGRVIEGAGLRPRYARFHDSQRSCCCWMLPDVPVLAKLMWMEGRNRFNVMTCFRPRGGAETAHDIRDLTRRRISLEKVGPVEWQTPETWKLTEERKSASPPECKEQPRSNRRRHLADGQKNWRRYLEVDLQQILLDE
jgi:hypothetical protein